MLLQLVHNNCETNVKMTGVMFTMFIYPIGKQFQITSVLDLNTVNTKR